MSTRTVLMAAVGLLTFGSAYFLLLYLAEVVRVRRLDYVSRRNEVIAEEAAREARGSIPDRAMRWLRGRGYTGDPAPLAALAVFGFVSLAATLAAAGLSEPVAVLVAATASPALLGAVVSFAASRRRTRGQKQMAQLIRGAVAHLEAGSTPSQAFAKSAEQLSAPLRDDVLRALRTQVGTVGLSEALGPVAESYPSAASKLMLAALDINDRVGSPLSGPLRQAERILRSQDELSSEAMAEVASSRSEFIGITAVVTVVAIALARQPMAAEAYRSPIGVTVLTLALSNYLLGVFRALRMFAVARRGSV